MARQYGSPPVSDQEQANLDKFGRDRRDASPSTKQEDDTPSNAAVTKFHKNASVDTTPTDIHHTLGGKPNQAASGAHTHNGSDSPLLLGDFIITGAKGGNTAVASIVQALVKLGAKDSTTA